MIFTSIYQGFIGLSYFWIILIISLVATAVTTLIYKYTTNQEKLKKTKADVKSLREKMNQHKGDQKKMLEIQQQMMSKNMEMMKSSFKPMIYTFIPLILLFSWMSGALAYEPLAPNEAFTITATMDETYAAGLDKVIITSIPELDIQRDDDYVSDKAGLKQIRWVATPKDTGTFQLLFESPTFKQTMEVLVSTEKEYSNPVSQYKNSQLANVVIGNKPVKPFKGVPVVGNFSWLWAYIVLSVVTSIGLRKALKVA